MMPLLSSATPPNDGNNIWAPQRKCSSEQVPPPSTDFPKQEDIDRPDRCHANERACPVISGLSLDLVRLCQIQNLKFRNMLCSQCADALTVNTVYTAYCNVWTMLGYTVYSRLLLRFTMTRRYVSVQAQQPRFESLRFASAKAKLPN